MDNWSRIVGAALLAYAAYSIYRGRVSVTDEYTNKKEYLTREDKPLLFWLLMLLFGGLGLALVLNLFNF